MIQFLDADCSLDRFGAGSFGHYFRNSRMTIREPFLQRLLRLSRAVPGRTGTAIKGNGAALRGAVVAHWYVKNANWGDALNPVLIELLSGRPAVHSRDVIPFAPFPRYAVIGSLLHVVGGRNLEIWGTGLISGDPSSRLSKMRVHPRRVHAVRGPLTRARLQQLGVACPEIYGDPALLYPRFYSPLRTKRYALGVVAHYTDAASPHLAKLREDGRVRLIDVLGGVNEVVDAVLECQHIASSSLHGLILADAYRIPSTWISLGDGITGGSFKYADYHLSVGHNRKEPLTIDASLSVDDILSEGHEPRCEVDLDRLLEACPFHRS